MRSAFKKVWDNNFLKGGLIFTVASFIGSVINYFFNVLAARGVGPSDFGDITALFSYMTIFSVPTLVMTVVIVQKIGSKGANSKNFVIAVQRWFGEVLKKSWIYMIPVMIFIPFVSGFTNLSVVSGYSFIPLVVLSFIGSFYGALLQGLSLFTWFSIIGIVTVLVKLLGPILVLLKVDGLTTIILFLFTSMAVNLFLSVKILSGNLKKGSIAPTHVIRKRIKDALINRQVIVAFLSLLALTAFNNLDVIFAKKYLQDTTAGIYSTWSLFAKIIFFLIGPITTVSYVFFSQKTSEKSHERVLIYSLVTLLGIGVASFIVYKYFAGVLIYYFFGKAFERVIPYLATASIFGFLYSVIAFCNNYFLAKNSYLSLLLALFIPLYTIMLFLIPKNIASFINLNLSFSSCIGAVYIIASVWSFFYNRRRWNSKNQITS